MKYLLYSLFSFQELYDIHFYFVRGNYLNIFAFLSVYMSVFVLANLLVISRSDRSNRVSLKHYYIPPMHNRRASFPQKSVNNGKFTISVEKQL